MTFEWTTEPRHTNVVSDLGQRMVVKEIEDAVLKMETAYFTESHKREKRIIKYDDIPVKFLRLYFLVEHPDFVQRFEFSSESEHEFPICELDNPEACQQVMSTHRLS